MDLLEGRREEAALCDGQSYSPRGVVSEYMTAMDTPARVREAEPRKTMVSIKALGAKRPHRGYQQHAMSAEQAKDGGASFRLWGLSRGLQGMGSVLWAQNVVGGKGGYLSRMTSMTGMC